MRAIAAAIGFLVLVFGLLVALGVMPINPQTVGGLAAASGAAIALGFLPWAPPRI